MFGTLLTAAIRQSVLGHLTNMEMVQEAGFVGNSDCLGQIFVGSSVLKQPFVVSLTNCNTLVCWEAPSVDAECGVLLDAVAVQLC